MKKVFLVAVALLAMFAANAQSGAKDFSYGAKLGLNISTLTNYPMNAKASFHIGAFAEWRITDLIGISPELLYSRQGESLKQGGDKYKFRVNYLNIPVLAKFYVWKDLSVGAGLQFGFALNSKSVAKEDGVKIKYKGNVNTFDLAIPINVAYSFDPLTVSARYNIGLTNLGGKTKNGVFQLAVAYRLSDLF